MKADMYADVTLQRKLVAGKWNTFCVPFALTAEQIEANKLGEVRRLSGMQASGEGITLDFDKVDAMDPCALFGEAGRSRDGNQS